MRPRTTILVQPACLVNAGCLATVLKILGFTTSLTMMPIVNVVILY